MLVEFHYGQGYLVYQYRRYREALRMEVYTMLNGNMIEQSIRTRQHNLVRMRQGLDVKIP